MKDEHESVNWDDFQDALHTRYDTTQYQDFFSDLTKQQQTGTVREHQTQFERNQATRKRPAPSETRRPVVNQNNSNRPAMPIKKLSPAELNECRANGLCLCFNCNDKFSPGHRCKKLFLIEGDWPVEDLDDGESFVDHVKNDDVQEISIHAISGARTQIMRVQGMIGLRRVTFLIYSESTHMDNESVVLPQN